MTTREFHHERFEELSALAALGQVSAQEFEELQSHLQTCGSCRAGYAEFAEILSEHLPMTKRAELSMSESGQINSARGFRERFVERARREGLRFSDDVLGKPPRAVWRTWVDSICTWPPKSLAASLALVALGGLLGLITERTLTKKWAGDSTAPEIKSLQSEWALLESRVRNKASRPTDVEPGRSPLKPSELPPASASMHLMKELDRLQREHDLATDRSARLDAQLLEKSNQLELVREELQAAKSEPKPTRHIEELEQSLSIASAELQKLRQEKAVYSSTFADQQTQIRALMEQLSAQTETLERERSLSSTARDIRNLMGARNLHIIDVADVDSRGGEKPFGRVFYTEGTSLIFYAYDLDKRKKSLERYSFQAWGQKEARNGAAHSLGVFVADDQAQNRWVLKYDDPSVLTQIEAVFVTVEPKGGSERPQGRQLMYAFLKANPNHP